MHQRRLLLATALLCATPAPARAHEIPERVAINAFVAARDTTLRVILRVPLAAMRDLEFPLGDDGSLDLVAVRALLPEAAQVWLIDGITIEADGAALGAPRLAAARISLPNDRAFESYAAALAHLRAAPLGNDTRIAWQNAFFDVELEYRLPRADARLVLLPELAHLGIRTTSVLRIVGADDRERILIYEGDPDRLPLEPRWYDAATRFVREGFWHILGGYDHLLFVLCLVLPVRRWRPLVAIVTAFTLAHSVTLGFAAVGYAPTALWFPPLVEAAIAASIVWLALENLVVPVERLERRWMLAFGFGLVHGFGFSFALGETLQFAGGHRAMALATFNLGVELGQLLVLVATIPLLRRLAERAGPARERLLIIVGSVVVAHAAWHWMTDRITALGAFRGAVRVPALDGVLLLGAMRIALVLTVALAVAVAFRQLLRTVWRP